MSKTGAKVSRPHHKDWEQELNNAGYFCTKEFGNSVKVSLGTKPIGGAFLFGPAGTGKSFLPEKVAEVLNATYYFYQCFPGTREDDLISKILPSEETISGIKNNPGVLKQAVDDTHKKKPVVLVLDEWDKTRPSADSFLLDFLQNGRLNLNDITGTAKMDNLYIFITMNDERDLSEPLLRRLPKIDFKPLPLKLVARALKISHPKSNHLEPALILYQRCVDAYLSKPCTIQELRQLLDAIDVLGQNANWDDLVYQFVTKTVENHNKLARGKGGAKKEDIRMLLDAGNYDAEHIKEYSKDIEEDKKEDARSGMPKLARDIMGFDPSFVYKKDIDKKDTYGIIKHTDDNYDALVHAVNEDPHEDPAVIGKSGQVVCEGGFLSFKKQVDITDIHSIDEFWGTPGEISFREPHATINDVKHLTHMKIVKYSKGEVISKHTDGKIDLRWTPKNGAEIIVDLEAYDVFRSIFGEVDDPKPEKTWIAEPYEYVALINAGQKPGESVAGLPYDKFGVMYQRRFSKEFKKSKEKKIKDMMKDYVIFEEEFDFWTSENCDSLYREDIPLWDDFLQEGGLKSYLTDGRRYYEFENIIFWFEETCNDAFGMKITGKFKKQLLRYIKAWLPSDEKMTFSLDSTLGIDYFIEKHGFSVTNDKYAVGTYNDIDMVVSPEVDFGTVTIYMEMPDGWDYADLEKLIKHTTELHELGVKKELNIEMEA